MSRSSGARAALALLLLFPACRTGSNYAPADAPRYAGSPAVGAPASEGDTLRVVSFNIAFAVAIDSAIALLREDTALRRADFVLLQEMDATGTARIADALRMHWVYYPAVRSRRTGRDFGNAVLSRRPIVDDARVLLPHQAWANRTQRTATRATVLVNGRPVRLYSTHLGTAVEVGSRARRDQLGAIIDDALGQARVVIGGDLNDEDVGAHAVERGYAWLTREGPRTSALARWDHILARGFVLAHPGATGTILHVRGASDHRPVWVVLIPD